MKRPGSRPAAACDPPRYLRFAALQRAYLGGAHLKGVHLEGSDLEGARLAAYLVGAVSDVHTRWPEDFDWRAAGVTPSGLTGTVGGLRASLVDGDLSDGPATWRRLSLCGAELAERLAQVGVT